MKSLFLVMTLLFAPLSPALAGHHEGPSVEAFIQDYFDRFNATTLELIQSRALPSRQSSLTMER